MADLAADPIVIYGSPRSGTTFLVRILNQHPDIFITNETRIFVWIQESINITNETEEGNRIFFRHREEFVEHLRAVYPDLVRDFYRKLSPGTRYWGDKNPHYADPENLGCLDTIVALFPGTRFVHLIRDGRDVITSRLRRRQQDFDVVHQMWMDHVDLGRTFGESLAPGQYVEVRYEDLILDDVGTTGRLLDFLGVEMDSKVLAFLELQQRARTPFSKPTRELRAEVITSEWNSYWSPELRLRSLALLGDHLVRYNYETETSLANARSELERLVAS